MKRLLNRRIAAVAALAGLAILTGCGGNSTNGANGVGGINGGLGYGTGGCLPITSQIGFTGSNVYFDAYNIRGGLIPSGQAIGQMTVTTAAAGGPYQRQGSDGTISMNIVQQGTPGYGYQTPYPQTPYPQTQSTASVTGFLALSQLVQNDIMTRFGGTTGGYAYPYAQPGTTYPYTQASTVCVSGIAMDLGHTYQGYLIYGGQVYLYLNNTQHGYVVYF